MQRFSDMMEEMCYIVATKNSGSLKGEHGTGRNMAPFVEMEWGTKVRVRACVPLCLGARACACVCTGARVLFLAQTRRGICGLNVAQAIGLRWGPAQVCALLGA